MDDLKEVADGITKVIPLPRLFAQKPKDPYRQYLLARELLRLRYRLDRRESSRKNGLLARLLTEGKIEEKAVAKSVARLKHAIAKIEQDPDFKGDMVPTDLGE